MKVIHSVFGNAALRVSADEVLPETGVNVREFIEFIGNTYRFSAKPQISSIIQPEIGAQQLIFQSGVFSTENERFPIMQIASVPNGDIVTASNTEIADIILDDYINKLDVALKFRFASAKTKRLYQSNIVVQFDVAIEEKLETISMIETFLAREIPRQSFPFKIKRLIFGDGEPVAIPTLAMETIENSDFIVERRAGEPYSENRYFCAAPVSTSAHIRILEKFEKELLG
jgi:hypothetical protein